jgi:hypothetical protein
LDYGKVNVMWLVMNDLFCDTFYEIIRWKQFNT